MNNNSTHLVFDGKKIIISPDLTDIFSFLIEIEKEVECLLEFEKKLKNIRFSYMEILNFAQFLENKLKENNIDCNTTFQKIHPSLLKSLSCTFL